MFVVLNYVFFFSTKKLHEEMKDKESVLDVKEEKLAMEGMFISATGFV
jgi:hypothetical protein